MKNLNIKLILDIVIVGGILAPCGVIYIVIFGCENAYRIKDAAMWILKFIWSILKHVWRNASGYLSLWFFVFLTFLVFTSIGTYVPTIHFTKELGFIVLFYFLTVWRMGYRFAKEVEGNKKSKLKVTVKTKLDCGEVELEEGDSLCIRSNDKNDKEEVLYVYKKNHLHIEKVYDITQGGMKI